MVGMAFDMVPAACARTVPRVNGAFVRAVHDRRTSQRALGARAGKMCALEDTPAALDCEAGWSPRRPGSPHEPRVRQPEPGTAVRSLAGRRSRRSRALRRGRRRRRELGFVLRADRRRLLGPPARAIRPTPLGLGARARHVSIERDAARRGSTSSCAPHGPTRRKFEAIKHDSDRVAAQTLRRSATDRARPRSDRVPDVRSRGTALGWARA